MKYCWGLIFFFILMDMHLLIGFIFCRAPCQCLDTTRQSCQCSHANFKWLARNALKPFQRFDFNYILWDSQLSLYILINETSSWNPALPSLFTHFKKQEQENLKRMEREKENYINETEENNKTKSNTSEKRRAGGQVYVFSFAKHYFLMQFPTEVILKSKNTQGSHSVL